VVSWAKAWRDEAHLLQQRLKLARRKEEECLQTLHEALRYLRWWDDYARSPDWERPPPLYEIRTLIRRWRLRAIPTDRYDDRQRLLNSLTRDFELERNCDCARRKLLPNTRDTGYHYKGCRANREHDPERDR
jgi:hypothetical protein